jgi:predicted aconitase with swiveling domain
MAARGVMPAALVFNTVNPIMAQGAALAGVTLMSGFAEDVTAAVPDGALIELDPTATPPVLRILAA